MTVTELIDALLQIEAAEKGYYEVTFRESMVCHSINDVVEGAGWVDLSEEKKESKKERKSLIDIIRENK